jgi:hypothetical protein
MARGDQSYHPFTHGLLVGDEHSGTPPECPERIGGQEELLA